MAYTSKQIGSKYSSSFKAYILKDGKVVSPFHDIPLMVDGSFNYVTCINEISRFEHGKFEICKEASFNPICQDVKKDKVRFVKNVFPSFGYPFNYGALPQTWENPMLEDSECKARGDNDPVDIVEIGSKVKKIGEVYQGKVLGALALLDDNEADWKIIVIDSKDEMAGKVNDIEDVRHHFPGLLEWIFKWFRDYKVPDGKPKNIFAFNGKFLNARFAKDVIKKTHESWKSLIVEGYKK
ncbi:uncharacterized protein VICG_01562 [Vittaforma corneae ATCC 50505]|uniref:inorganic diphosphatase n=1 Tax=Vittaforma corneae (strain ATCC 50505) TaxID=993615 RepID=L2GMD9_VITCO|nr:uncharacterized protein VICG_01562 [Vittaforma corneae ATCC 50505]ELA41457.1 hypothetical protein VICG_01562 [Vittaforma corneae ATCC 50505]